MNYDKKILEDDISRNKKCRTGRGLILIQIDGLSRAHLKKAVKKGNMPFLGKLVSNDQYKNPPLYSGVPSTTPAVQGELFYGIKAIVPAFSFRDHESGKLFRMYDPEAADQVEGRLCKRGRALLKTGRSYGNIYSGGAQKAHFCIVSFEKERLLTDFNLLKSFFIFYAYSKVFVKSIFLLGIELVLAIIDFFRGMLSGKNFFKELKMIFSRLAVTILLRDMMKTGAIFDIKSGTKKIIHLNFMGYDEHAHRRGPSSRFAYWTLKGIDAAVKEICNAACRSKIKDYDLWLYSDHGQEETVSYQNEQDNSLSHAVYSLFSENQSHLAANTKTGNMTDEMNVEKFYHTFFQGGRFLHKFFPSIKTIREREELSVTAMGPLGHIYLPEKPDPDEKRRFGRMLAQTAKIPLVMMPDGADRVIAWNETGEFVLPKHSR
ncbi:MAG: hypothetical protein U9Q84_05680 [Thermodesulfobacteriota bacterium]|nr:hypothetical protein [Thermodesulfobacteriota bacterium]